MIAQIPLGIANAFLILEDRPVLVDSGSAAGVPRLLKALATHGVGPRDLALVIHTHAHSDHCGGTAELVRLAGIPVAIHPAEAASLCTGKGSPSRPATLSGRVMRPWLRVEFPPVEADLLVNDGFLLEVHGVGGRIVATPGHTDGSISILLDSGDAVVGDLLMGGYLGGKVLPRRPGCSYFANDPALVRQGIVRLLDLGARRLFVGHGGPLDAERVRKRFAPR
ncbi:MAG: MBL fold metallo-hydrolase [Pirellulales bacterium]